MCSCFAVAVTAKDVLRFEPLISHAPLVPPYFGEFLAAGNLDEVSFDKRGVISLMTDAIQDAMTFNNQLLNGVTNDNNQSFFPEEPSRQSANVFDIEYIKE